MLLFWSDFNQYFSYVTAGQLEVEVLEVLEVIFHFGEIHEFGYGADNLKA